MEENECAKIVHTTMCRELMRIAKEDNSGKTNMREVPKFMKMLEAISVLEELYPTLKEHGV